MKKLLITLVLMITILLLCSCHHNRVVADFDIPEDFDVNKSYEITFWAKNDSNRYQKKIYEQAILEFNKYYPNIKVNMVSYTNYNDIYNDVLKNIATNTTPNVCISYIDHVATYNDSADIVIKLEGLMEDKNFGFGGKKLSYESVKRDEIYQKFLDEGLYKDHYYTLPFMRSTEALYVNIDYVKWLGYDIGDTITWDLMFEIALKAYEKRSQGLSPYKTLTTSKEIKADLNKFFPVIYKSVDNQLITMLEQNDYPYSDDNGTLMFNQNTKEVLTYLGEKKKEGLFEIFNVVSYPGNHFNIGNCLFAIDSTAGATWMGSDAPLSDIHDSSLFVDFEVKTMALPQTNLDNVELISQGPSICIFNKDDNEEVLASWLFANFLLTDYVQIKYSQTEGYIPVTSKAINSESYQKYLNSTSETKAEDFEGLISNTDIYKDLDVYLYKVKIDAAKMAIANIDNTFITIPFNGSMSVRNAAGYLIEYTIKNAKRNELNDKFFDELFDKTAELYKLNISEEKDDNLSKDGIILLGIIAGTWVLIGLYSIRTLFAKLYYDKIRKKNVEED